MAPASPPSSVLSADQLSTDGSTRVFDPRGDAREDIDEARALDDEAVEPGTRVGRYMILDAVGSGGVGVVFSAYDPNLDRRVAIKQLRRSKREGHSDAVVARRTRLAREAQALARLSHPNVVPVYEVLSHAGQLHVVMEFVEGKTLGAWLEGRDRSWAEIVAMFVQAGRGLAAAHAAGIVHRDFKPDNVRVGVDGRPRVLDFGLASPLREGEQVLAADSLNDLLERSYDDSWSESGERLRDGGVTREGQVMGTPAYMAPEQASGGLVDARSDQFSFCVALYEAIYGRRPFRGRFDNPRRFRDLSRLRSLPGKRPAELPSELERVLLRGLALMPEGRFESMDELLSELAVAAEGTRRLWWLPLCLGLLALLAVIAYYEQRSSEEAVTCDGGESLLVGVWDPAVRDELHVAVLAADAGYAEAVWARAETGFDAWAAAWSRARVRACEATHHKEEQSPELLERRIACLDRQLVQIESMSSGLRRQRPRPAELLEHLESLALPSPDSCAGATLLEGDALDPSDTHTRARVDQTRAVLAEVEGLRAVADYAGATSRATQALEAARELSFAPLIAEAQLALGLAVHRENKEPSRAAGYLRDAAWSAQRAGHDAVLVRAAAALAAHAGSEQAQLEAGQLWAELARATFERHGRDLGIEAEVRRDLGEFALAQGDFATALGEYQRALDIAAEREGENSLAYINALRSIGSTQTELGQYDEAVSHLAQARALATGTLGARHPAVPEILDSLGSATSSRGDFEQAIELHRAALELNEELYGEEHRRVAQTLNNLAIIYDNIGRYGEASRTLGRAREILVSRLGADHPDVAYIDVNLGSALQNLGRHGDALVRYEAALSVLEDSFGPMHMAVGVALQNLGYTRWRLGDAAGALADFERSASVLEPTFGHEHPALAELELNRARVLRDLARHDEGLAAAGEALRVLEKVLGDAHPSLVEVLTVLTNIQFELGNLERARSYGERAVRLCAEGQEPADIATAHLALASVLVATEPARARELALAALAALEGADGSDSMRAELEAWMSEHL